MPHANETSLGKKDWSYALARAKETLEGRDINHKRFVCKALEAIAAQFWKLLKLFAHLWTDAMTRASLLSFGSTARGLAARAATAYAFTTFILSCPLEIVKLHSS